ncbi:transposase [Pseudomonas luteola]|uniref:transposase n=1 Tax=Pseudomonas luteola TaxID=47886 RepID=UPI003DA16151
MLEAVCLPSLLDRPIKRCRTVWADKGYDSEALRQCCDRFRIKPSIPLRQMHRHTSTGPPRLFDRATFRKRNVIERLFNWIKEHRRIATRFEKLTSSFKSMISLARLRICLIKPFKTESNV